MCLHGVQAQVHPGPLTWRFNTSTVKGVVGIVLITCLPFLRGYRRGIRGPTQPEFLPPRRSPAGVCRCAAQGEHAWSPDHPETNWWRHKDRVRREQTGEVILSRAENNWREESDTGLKWPQIPLRHTSCWQEVLLFLSRSRIWSDNISTA